MWQRSFAGIGRRRRDALVLAGALAAALAGAGPTAAVAGSAGPARGTPGAGVISTVAGGVGGPAKATKVAVAFPCGVKFGAGHLYIANGLPIGEVRTVDPGTDGLTTPAGTGAVGPLGDGGPAPGASLGSCAAAPDHSGNLVIADSFHDRVRVAAASTGNFYGRAMTAGHIYTVAGNGQHGFSGDGGPATKAEILPLDVAVDAAGNLVIDDSGNSRIRVVAVTTGTFYGQGMTAGDIYTVAGNGTDGFSGDGGPATSAELSGPEGVALDAAGNLVVGDTSNHRIRVVAVAPGTFYGQAMTAGDIYTVAGDGTKGFSGDRGPATRAKLNFPEGVALDAVGNLVIADRDNQRVRVVAARTGTFYGQAMTARDIYTVAGDGSAGFFGDGGPATGAKLHTPTGVAVDAAGNLLIADEFNGRVRAVAARTGTFYGQAMTAGNIDTVAGNGLGAFSGDGGPAASAQVGGPAAVALDSAGNLLIADSGNNRVRAVAARAGKFYGKAMTAGNIYTVAGNGTLGSFGDGGPATRAEVGDPEAMAVDAAGNLLIAAEFDNRVRAVAAATGTFYGQGMTAGDIYPVAGNGVSGFSGDGGPALRAEFRGPEGMAVDAAGNVLIADKFNNRIRAVAVTTGTFYGQAMTAGDIYTVAGNGTAGFSGDGGPATSAALGNPNGVTLDRAGNLVIADTGNGRVRVVAVTTGTFYGQAMTAGDIYTVARNGALGVAVDAAGNVVIADPGDQVVRVRAVKTGTFYGVAMTAGGIFTVAGNGTPAFAGDGGPATRAELFGPIGVAVDAAGNLLIADFNNQRIRKVTG